ncbi:proline-rich protein 36 [Ixodes scapularis]|uniref:proline-rich protein 36 n=1 Tax=Ixodes scapularis TaxID=6945 RepID=UPI001C388D4C|nr:proline-rich protein 36 [Ixodes scapularis]
MGTGMMNGQLRSGHGTSGTQDKARERARPEEAKPRGGPQPSQPGLGETLQRVPGGVSGAFPRQQVTTGSAWGETDACPLAAGAGSAFSTPLANGQQRQLAPPQDKAPPAESAAVAPVFASIPRTVPLTSVSQTVPQQPTVEARPQDAYQAQSAFTPVAPQHHAAPQQQAATQHPVAPQHQTAPQHHTAPQHQAASQQQAVPQFQPVPQHQTAPQQQSTSQYQALPQHQSAPQFQTAPQHQTTLQQQNGPQYQSPPQHQGAIQYQSAAQYQTGPQPQHQASPQQQAPQQYQAAPQHQTMPQQQAPPSVEVIEPQAGDSAQERLGADVDQKPKSIELAQKRTKPESQDWSPVTDLSPILDVSPSVEAAEQELMRRFQEDDRPPLGIPRATSGTISGMLADFNKAMGLASPGQEPPGESADTPATPKRVHRRLPQPTMEQMQAAVALAAQGPGQSARPVSPMVPAARKEAGTTATAVPTVAKPVPAPRAISAPTVLTVAVSGTVVTATVAPPGATMTPQPAPCKDELGVPGGATLSSSPVPLTRTLTPVTPQTPGPQGGDSSDTPSEADSSGGKVRRKLPPLPQDQEPSPVPARRAKDRARVLSAGALDRSPRPKPQPPRASSMDGATASLHGSSLLLPSTAPRSASPALLAGLCDRPSSAFLFADAGSKLPSYMNSLKQQLREELKTVTGAVRAQVTKNSAGI